MKLKTLFLLLNIVLIAVMVLCFFAFSSFLPIISGEDEGSGLTIAFIVSVAVCIFLLAVLIIADIFVLRRAKMFDALMAENWPALAAYLEREMLDEGRISKREVGLFISVLVLLSDYETLRTLFLKLKKEKPDIYRIYSPDFIAASIVFSNEREAEKCIDHVMRDDAPSKEGETEKAWARFYRAFLAFRNGDYRSSSEEFAALASTSDEPVVRAVSGFFCGKLIPSKTFGIGVSMTTLLAAASSARDKTRASYKRKRWDELCSKTRKKVRAAVIGKTIASATEWIWGE